MPPASHPWPGPRATMVQFKERLVEPRQFLGRRGLTISRSGSYQSGRLAVAIHSDYGPPDQDKGPNNQDYALAWFPREGSNECPVQLALALGDGLTSSYLSELASRLACWAALRALVDHPELSPWDRARQSLEAARLALSDLAASLRRDPEGSWPKSQIPFLSTWKYILNKGALLQTTLTLAWLEQDQFHLALVGDGGALWREGPGPAPFPAGHDAILAECDPTTNQVHALGPACFEVGELDGWVERDAAGPFVCVLHTDGLGRGRGYDPGLLLDELEGLRLAGGTNPAQEYVAQALHTRPGDFSDNLTLTVLWGKEEPPAP